MAGRATRRSDELRCGDVQRLWRLRRRHDHIDALVGRRGASWELSFVRNDRVLVTRSYPTRDAAHADAAGRRRELERAGWNTHW
jgi:hypothetical protein